MKDFLDCITPPSEAQKCDRPDTLKPRHREQPGDRISGCFSRLIDEHILRTLDHIAVHTNQELCLRWIDGLQRIREAKSQDPQGSLVKNSHLAIRRVSGSW